MQLDRVTKVERGGKRMRFRATVVAGNYEGTVGIGVGKAKEVRCPLLHLVYLM